MAQLLLQQIKLLLLAEYCTVEFLDQILGQALGEGMRTLRQDGMEKVLAGITDMKQVRKVCVR